MPVHYVTAAVYREIFLAQGAISEQGAFNYAALIFQAEVNMAVWRAVTVGNLAAQPYIVGMVIHFKEDFEVIQ